MTPTPQRGPARHHPIDPELAPGLAAMLAASGSRGLAAGVSMAQRREVLAAVTAAALADEPAPADLDIADHVVAHADGPDVPVRHYRSRAITGPRPGMLVLHAGGMVAGSIDQEELIARRLATELRVDVVSVGYRLAPEHPAPAALVDAYAALTWLAERVPDVHRRRLAVFGRSAGGGLAAGLALWARDRGGPALCCQVLAYPMLDDRCQTPSSYEVMDVGVWDRAANVEAWNLYLAGRARKPDVSPYAAPGRATDLAGLPPTYLDVGTVDVFRDEVMAYASGLLAAGVPTELHVWPGAFHAAEKFSPAAALSQQMWAVRRSAMRRMLAAAPTD